MSNVVECAASSLRSCNTVNCLNRSCRFLNHLEHLNNWYLLHTIAYPFSYSSNHQDETLWPNAKLFICCIHVTTWIRVPLLLISRPYYSSPTSPQHQIPPLTICHLPCTVNPSVQPSTNTIHAFLHAPSRDSRQHTTPTHPASQQSNRTLLDGLTLEACISCRSTACTQDFG
jgi:hypothetical protein